MATIRYIGNFDALAEGKVLLELLSQLRKFGVGRMVTKSEWMRKWPQQPSYILIKKVEPDMDRWLWRGTVYGEWCFRGRNLGLYKFDKDLDRADWKLVHRKEEHRFIDCKNPLREIPIPTELPLPPLQRILLKRERQHRAETLGEALAAQTIPIDALPITDTCLDEEHTLLAPFIKPEPKLNAPIGGSVYDGFGDADVEQLLDAFYGRQPPVKVEKWFVQSISQEQDTDEKVS